ncbi:cytochrome P450 2J2-like [Empidonax traillii]|uniref:cytochrome P450 2J2-like n=1 Tax=Empidonax traillii TaxID=164674 RepID=UPI000FFDB72E|nr:cytochrome P450 2J2-like [Empidonax traillii]
MLHCLWDSISFPTLLIFLIVFLFVADYMKNRNPKNFPPTPLRLPFIGHLYLMDFKDPIGAVMKLTEKYGDIVGTSMGSMKFVIVNGMRLVKEVLVNQGENFLERPEMPIEKDMSGKIGLINSSGHLWKAQRRFTLTTLRNFGLGKRSVEERIQEECRFLVDAIKDEQGECHAPLSAAGLKGTIVMTNITSVMFDKNEWETPDTFNPQHFLKDGKFWKRESFLAFSIGKRACLGELLARSELFLFFTSLLQKFTFQAPPDTTLSLQCVMGITMAPQPYKICAVPR